ncbi:MAG: putative ABC exporter domain-containing protein, partial [Limisphaerales bacterium]
YPLKGWQLVLGEMLAPAVILTAIQWCLVIFSAGLFSHSNERFLAGAGSLSIGLGAAMLVPALNFIILLIPNAAVLIFPAWFLPGKEAAHGIEATGQRIIFMLGQLLVFLLTLIPPAIGFALVFLGMRYFLAANLVVAIPIASFAAAVVLAGEGALGLSLLGHFFERFDLSSELNS